MDETRKTTVLTVVRRWCALVVLGLVLVAAGPAAAQEGGGSETGDEAASADQGASESEGDKGAGPTTPGSEGIDIDVSGTARRELTPMAIPDTREPADDTGGVALKVQEILRRDIELSGFFKMLPTDSFFFDPSEEGMGTSEIKFKNWFNIGAQGLIKSAVRTDGDEVKLDLRLYEVDTGNRIDLDWEAGAADKDDYEEKVHEFVNAVLKYYTGKQGIFGSRITFVKRDANGLKQIFVAQMDGTNRRQITNNTSINLLPSWGGGAVYYTSYRDHNPDLWRWEGGKHKKVSSRKGQNTGAAHCNGKVALTLSMGGENADVYLVDGDSGKMKKRLTDSWAIDTSPAWSPDCSKIAFVSGRSGSPQIYVMNADGSGERRLTFEGSYNTSPDWSPKGNRIAFTARDKYNRFDIFLVDLEGNLTRLTQDQGNNEEPSFSPDGRYIVFASDRGGKGNRLWLMTADGQIQKPITPEESGFTAPDWEK